MVLVSGMDGVTDSSYYEKPLQPWTVLPPEPNDTIGQVRLADRLGDTCMRPQKGLSGPHRPR